VELDEQEGLVFYRVRGLSPMTTAMVPFPQPPPRAITARQKSTFWGAAFGLVFPGFGLFYAAPWKVVGLASLATLLAVKMTAAIPILGPLLSSVTLGICAIASAVLGVLYTKQFNQFGRRASLDRQQVVSHTARWPQAAASAVNTAFHRAG
jgi:hypothetical protein